MTAATDVAHLIKYEVTIADIRRAHSEGKIAALMGMEGGHMESQDAPARVRAHAARRPRARPRRAPALRHSRKHGWRRLPSR